MLHPGSLDSVGIKHRTDKSSSYHDYLSFYEMFFAPIRNEPLTILEIGVFSGASLRTWEEYFPNARIIGVDIVPTAKRYEKGRIKIELADQSNINDLTNIALKYAPFDIVIEDGSHMWEHQITSLRTLFPFLKNDGIYIVEDLHTNYGTFPHDYKGVASSSCVEYLKAWLDLRVSDNQIAISQVEDAFLRTYGRAAEFLTFYRRACLIKKKLSPTIRQFDIGQPLIEKYKFPDATHLLITAHVGIIGDVVGPHGFINFDTNTYPIQGISIESENNTVEYRVRFPDKSWSSWIGKDEFAGTQGRGILLTGFAVRLRHGMRQRYALRACGRFAEHDDLIEVGDGEDCIHAAGTALCGIQVELMRIAG